MHFLVRNQKSLKKCFINFVHFMGKLTLRSIPSLLCLIYICPSVTSASYPGGIEEDTVEGVGSGGGAFCPGGLPFGG
jgi:hypothetical protein